MKTLKTLKTATAAALFAASALIAVPASAASTNPLLRDCLLQKGCQELPEGGWLCWGPNDYGDCWAQYGDAG